MSMMRVATAVAVLTFYVTMCPAVVPVVQQDVASQEDRFMLDDEELRTALPSFEKEIPLWQCVGVKVYVGCLAVQEWLSQQWRSVKKMVLPPAQHHKPCKPCQCRCRHDSKKA